MEFKSPAYNVIAVPVEKIKANTYNPMRCSAGDEAVIREH